MYDTTTAPLPTGFVIPNGSWGRDDDWTGLPGDVPGRDPRDPLPWKEPRDRPLEPLYWAEPAD